MSEEREARARGELAIVGREGGRAELVSACLPPSPSLRRRVATGRVVVGRLVGWVWLLGIARVPEIPRRGNEGTNRRISETVVLSLEPQSVSSPRYQ